MHHTSQISQSQLNTQPKYRHAVPATWPPTCPHAPTQPHLCQDICAEGCPAGQRCPRVRVRVFVVPGARVQVQGSGAGLTVRVRVQALGLGWLQSSRDQGQGSGLRPQGDFITSPFPAPLTCQRAPSCLPPLTCQTAPSCLPPLTCQTAPSCLPPLTCQTAPSCLPQGCWVLWYSTRCAGSSTSSRSPLPGHHHTTPHRYTCSAAEHTAYMWGWELMVGKRV